MSQRHHKSDFSPEMPEEPMELESRILQILYLFNGGCLSSGKIAHLLPGKHLNRRLVDLLLHDLSKRELVVIQEVQTLIHSNARGWEKSQHICMQNPENDNKVIVQRDESGNPNILDLTRTVYSITEKGIKMIQNGNPITNL